MVERPIRGLRVLIVRVGAMGDVLHGLPAVAALRREVPECFIGWAVEPRWAALLEPAGKIGQGGGPIVDMVHTVPTTEWKREPVSARTLKSIAGLRRELRGERYDICVDFQGSVRSAVIGRMAGAGRFLGSDAPREKAARRLYGEQVTLRQDHVIGQACELVGAALGVTELEPGRVLLPVDGRAEESVTKKLGGLGINAGENVCVLAPTAGWGAKEWPAARYAELAQELSGTGIRVLVNARPGGDKVADEIVAAGKSVAFPATVAELVALTRKAELVIGGDTGPVHLAAALGRPVVALFGPTDPRRNGPSFPVARVRMLRNAGSVTTYKRTGETEAGLQRITVEEVMGAVEDVLRNEKEQDG